MHQRSSETHPPRQSSCQRASERKALGQTACFASSQELRSGTKGGAHSKASSLRCLQSNGLQSEAQADNAWTKYNDRVCGVSKLVFSPVAVSVALFSCFSWNNVTSSTLLASGSERCGNDGYNDVSGYVHRPFVTGSVGCCFAREEQAGVILHVIPARAENMFACLL